MSTNSEAYITKRSGQIAIHDPEGFEGMRKAGRLAAQCLDMLIPHVKPGTTTKQLDDLAREFILDHKALPACLFYRGYRHTICTSLNHVICHGIPGSKALREGDIVNIDVTAIIDGWHGDTSRMFAVGATRRKAQRLMDITYEALMRGISAVKPGARVGAIGQAIAEYAAIERVSVVEDFCGHGVGQRFHDAPNIVHTGHANEGVFLEPGMFFTIEPMLNLGRKDSTILADGWTAITRDRCLSAQYEHSLGVTETGVEIFTESPTGQHTPHKINA